ATDPAVGEGAERIGLRPRRAPDAPADRGRCISLEHQRHPVADRDPRRGRRRDLRLRGIGTVRKEVHRRLRAATSPVATWKMASDISRSPIESTMSFRIWTCARTAVLAAAGTPPDPKGIALEAAACRTSCPSTTLAAAMPSAGFPGSSPDLLATSG